jgi:hypothetical protein
MCTYYSGRRYVALTLLSEGIHASKRKKCACRVMIAPLAVQFSVVTVAETGGLRNLPRLASMTPSIREGGSRPPSEATPTRFLGSQMPPSDVPVGLLYSTSSRFRTHTCCLSPYKYISFGQMTAASVLIGETRHDVQVPATVRAFEASTFARPRSFRWEMSAYGHERAVGEEEGYHGWFSQRRDFVRSRGRSGTAGYVSSVITPRWIASPS